MTLAPAVQRPSRPRPFSTDGARWQAVATRDRAADGAFVYAVKTTGVFCRPSCGARRPRRENVEFHRTPADAGRAGFRPCKRCRPEDAQSSSTSSHAAAVARACRLVERADAAPRVDALAGAAGMSASHFHRVFKSLTGLTPKAYAAGRRAARVREALSRGDTVTAALYDAGFNSGGRFYAAADRALA